MDPLILYLRLVWAHRNRLARIHRAERTLSKAHAGEAAEGDAIQRARNQLTDTQRTVAAAQLRHPRRLLPMKKVIITATVVLVTWAPVHAQEPLPPPATIAGVVDHARCVTVGNTVTCPYVITLTGQDPATLAIGGSAADLFGNTGLIMAPAPITPDITGPVGTITARQVTKTIIEGTVEFTDAAGVDIPTITVIGTR